MKSGKVKTVNVKGFAKYAAEIGEGLKPPYMSSRNNEQAKVCKGSA